MPWRQPASIAERASWDTALKRRHLLLLRPLAKKKA
jgi:hypothetical protein